MKTITTALKTDSETIIWSGLTRKNTYEENSNIFKKFLSLVLMESGKEKKNVFVQIGTFLFVGMLFD